MAIDSCIEDSHRNCIAKVFNAVSVSSHRLQVSVGMWTVSVAGLNMKDRQAS